MWCPFFCPQMKLASERRDADVICGIKARPSRLQCVSVALLQRKGRYLGEGEPDRAGWRQSGGLSDCRGLDGAHIKGRREEAGGASQERGAAGVILGGHEDSAGVNRTSQTSHPAPTASLATHSSRLTRSHLQVCPNA